jgi:hypothetical protein
MEKASPASWALWRSVTCPYRWPNRGLIPTVTLRAFAA